MTIGIVGAGAMGGGIGRAVADSGEDVLIYDVRVGAAAGAIEDVSASLARRAAKGLISEAEVHKSVQRMKPVPDIEDLAGCRLVLEAVVEDPDIKRRVFAQLESVVDPECVLASNTSSLSIGSIFRDLKRPGRAIGMHFFNPVQAMDLVEVIPGPYTNEQTLELTHTLAAQLGKTAVETKDSPGFVVNMAGRAYATEALAIVRDGIATPEQVDRIMTGALKFPLGPFALMDLTGLDVNYPVTQNIFEQNFADPLLRSTWQHRYLYESGLHGQKSGRGFFNYPRSTASGGAAPHAVRSEQNAAADEVAQCRVLLLEQDQHALRNFCTSAGLDFTHEDDGESPILCAPIGEDCVAYADRLSVDARRLLAVDLAFATDSMVTLMVPPGANRAAVRRIAARIERSTPVTVINDSAGFVAQRIVACIVNLGCEMAQRGVAAPADIDLAVRLGLRYPAGPLALAQRHGPALILQILEAMHGILRDERYRTSQWLRRRVLSNLSIYEPDFSG